VQLIPMRPRVTQENLFIPPSPETQQLEITLARIRGFIGSADVEGLQCVGSPVVLDTHKPDSYLLRRFSSEEVVCAVSPAALPIVAMRRFRPAPETSVEMNGEKPHFVCFHKKHLRVLSASGPWRSSGSWWNLSTAWSREEWDVALTHLRRRGLLPYLFRSGWETLVRRGGVRLTHAVCRTPRSFCF